MSHSIFDMRRHPLALCLCAAMGIAVVAPVAYAADKPAQQQISRAIAKEMMAAQKAAAASQWTEVLKNLDGLDTRPGLTAYDKTHINDLRGYSYVKLNKLKEAEGAYEAAMGDGAYSPEEKEKITYMLFQLSAQNQQNAKAIEYGKAVTETSAAKPNDFLVMAQLYYLQKDCKTSAVWADKAVAAYRKANETPKEVLFQFKLQCASDAGDNAGMKAGLVDLIRVTNKTNYWNNLIRLERQDERDDKNTLMLYRIMYDTNSMNADTDYIEMAQLLGDASLPGEAAAVLDKAMSTGQIKDEHKERTTRLLNALKGRADTDKKSLPALDAEASKNAAGQLDVKLGEVYFGTGDYQNTVTAINRGLGKGQVKDQDQAYVYLGRAYVALKNNGEAKKAFEKLKSVPNESPRVLKLWELYSEKLGS
jgi:tetratricopeptide (TPR) repeat protein